MQKLDYREKDFKKRKEIVEQVCTLEKETLTSHNLETLADYFLNSAPLEKHEINTSNRMSTINKRETSLETLESKFEPGGKDAIYQFVREDKNMILSPKFSITKKDLDEIPFLKDLKDSIDRLKKIPVKNYIVHKAIIEMSQTQYLIKEAYLKPLKFKSTSHFSKAQIDWNVFLDFTDIKHTKAFLHLYSKLKNAAAEEPQSDMYWILWDFEKLVDKALEKDPMLYDIVKHKVDGLKGEQIRKQLDEDYGTTYSIEYISSLYNNKIPKLIAEEANRQELIHHYTFVEKGNWKKCNRCGHIKLVSPEFFTRNNGNKSGFYSICKTCRNKK